MVIKESSALKSIIQRLKRDGNISLNNESNVVDIIKWYYKAEQRLNKFRDMVSTSTESLNGDDIMKSALLGFDIITENGVSNIVKENQYTSDKKIYPIYAILFSNATNFGKMIKATTGSMYSHATVTLDPSLNDMYSFSDIPYNHASFTGAGFVRESIYSPMYRKNRYFTVLVTFTDAEGIKNYNEKLKIFKEDYTNYKYNDIGLMQYYLNFKNTKNHNIKKKTRWFCSEFVSYMLYTGKNDSFKDVLQAPSDIKGKEGMIVVGDYTLADFSEANLRKSTKVAYKEFLKIESQKESVIESYIEEDESFVYEVTDADCDMVLEAKIKDGVRKEKDVTPYTSLIDWKYLYEEFIKIFPHSNPELRFDLFEIIIRNFIIPLKINVNLTMKTIVDEMMKIKNMIIDNFGEILSIDVASRSITCSSKKNIEKTISYPEFEVKK